mmetsp:Transcript_8805/g.32462  ORF Transcript_8805/g.32462 Transcript_8805/m.32462 type:complete len:183 (+) Transcript_8805:121-669(+)
MLGFHYASLFVVGTWLPFLVFHYQRHEVITPLHVLVTLFNSINLLICLWELSLYFHQNHIQQTFAKLKKRYRSDVPYAEALFSEVSLSKALTLKHWGIIWAVYSFLDPSYSDEVTFGFWIDTGNGISMLVPSILMTVGLTWDIASARALGVLCMLANYQMMYGTIVYFAGYFHNLRYKGSKT